MTPANLETVHHAAQLAILAMCARGVAAAEFDTDSEVQQVVIVVGRPGPDCLVPSVDVSFLGTHSVPMGGLSL